MLLPAAIVSKTMRERRRNPRQGLYFQPGSMNSHSHTFDSNSKGGTGDSSSQHRTRATTTTRFRQKGKVGDFGNLDLQPKLHTRLCIIRSRSWSNQRPRYLRRRTVLRCNENLLQWRKYFVLVRTTTTTDEEEDDANERAFALLHID